jgi:hypothetical protein
MWKLLGVAGAATVAATGVLVVRAERTQRAMSPEEIRDRLHARLGQLPDDVPGSAAAPQEPPSDPPHKFRKRRR